MGRMYDSLRSRKDNGEVLSIDNLDDILLETLWYEESIPDLGIAELYSTTKENIRKLRHKLDITQLNCNLRYGLKVMTSERVV